MNVFPDPAEIVVDGGPIPAAADIAPDGGDGGAAAAVGGHLALNNVRDGTIEFHGGQGNEAALPERVETGAGYTLHMYGGGFHRVSADWRFPRCGVQDLWRQWWIGDTVRLVPPLRSLGHGDVKHLDNVPLADDEMHGRTGGYGARRRLSKKTLCDMLFLMNWMTERVEAAGHSENNTTISAVDRMFLSIAHLFADGARDSQKRWTSIVHTVRRAVAVERANGIVLSSWLLGELLEMLSCELRLHVVIPSIQHFYYTRQDTFFTF
ncbi:hypothetical protein IV203_015748 [Nitzschia inconspicua]|uniref:Uncharacterized protein n=1 Tax=Nitzschia inconspicua TaxID=303405 RepID=A0A9K3KQ32_9STRA|nr:hypothetical protein IV203_023837 [Nitzschia inconspicua]KAG7340866.1 hypothetical protein IV203_024409 [Nitzschia inconspicua]KAG7346623.1 hypothetical protein IV203_005692 [Nitzschia inconspicua]KAG7347406.1 hypothetical protein IV203_016111 [Nitzschia inconspicua]KAG7359159.1 hypothetical protein IV203_015748 [Nitzschia inconspicua]